MFSRKVLPRLLKVQSQATWQMGLGGGVIFSGGAARDQTAFLFLSEDCEERKGVLTLHP